MRVGFFVREALRAMRRNAAPVFAALATVLVTMLVVGVFIPAVEITSGAANSVRGRLYVEVFMKAHATRNDDARVERELRSTPHVKSVVFVSKAQALAQQKRQDPAAFSLLQYNPLPDAFHVFPDNPANLPAIRAALTPGGGAIDHSITSVTYKKSYTNKALELTSAVKWGGVAFAGLLAMASILLVANTIRLSLFARRREVEVMRLVGATNWFIRWPFVIEGVLVGALGAVLAIVVLAIAKVALLDPLFSNLALVHGVRTIAFPALLAILMGAGVLVSAVGSGVSLRRYLRV
jgi:cell division transport system permease protein